MQVTVPEDGATGVPVTTQPSASFSEPLDQATVTPANVSLTTTAGQSVAGQVVLSQNARTITVVPDAELASNTGYRLTLTATLADVAGNSLSAPVIVNFTTEGGDIIGPALLDLTPADGTTDVTVRPVIRAVFDEALDPATVGAEDLVLRNAASAVVASTLTTVAVFLPVIFVQDEAGQLFQDIALAISASVSLSLLVSITTLSKRATFDD